MAGDRSGRGSGVRTAGRAVRRGCVLLVLVLGWGCADAPEPEPLQTGPADPGLAPDRPLGWSDIADDTVAWGRVLEAEDRRASVTGDLDVLEAATASSVPGIRRAGVRALGRLERPDRVPGIVPSLRDEDVDVRREAANALAQAVHRADPGDPAVGEVASALLGRLRAGEGTEANAAVRGTLLRSFGRLPVADSAGAAGTADLLVELSIGPPDSLGEPTRVSPDELLGMARGAHLLFRRAAAAGLPQPRALADHLEGVAVASPDSPLPEVVRRTAALARLAATGVPPTADFLTALMQDADPGVRRVAAAAIPGLPEDAPRAQLVGTALTDTDAGVRVEGVRGWTQGLQETEGCAPLREASSDPSTAVALLALDGLGGTCPQEEAVPDLLASMAGTLPPDDDGEWHRPVRAFGALARIAPSQASPLLPRYVAHANPFVRTHAARAAGVLGDVAALRTLAGDPVPNVREAAITGLVPLEGPRADSILVAQLEFDDPQLLRTTARLMEGSATGGPAIPALFRALSRLSVQEASTTRDARIPLLQRIGELGSFWQAAQVDPLLQDIDPAVAAEAARVLEAWTGERATPAPRGLPALPLPTMEELRALEGTTAEITMDSGEVVVLRFLPFEAPTNAARFARMAREGTFDGLTLHRVVPNFVVQGGSPGANEYAGHGAYTRDEVGLIGHWKGTVGISTRGHDTGDGQIFVNLVDNLRLDHDYTIFAEVVEGMEVVESLQEGARMRTVRLLGDVEEESAPLDTGDTGDTAEAAGGMRGEA